jgi:hypothetical protein
LATRPPSLSSEKTKLNHQCKNNITHYEKNTTYRGPAACGRNAGNGTAKHTHGAAAHEIGRGQGV